MRMVKDTRKDYLEPLEAKKGEERLYLCVQKEIPNIAYTLNMTDPTNVTTNLLLEPQRSFSSFNIMAQILPNEKLNQNGH